MNKIYIFILALTTLFVVSCERRPLLEISNTHYLRVYIDEEIKNVTCDYYNPNYKQPVYKAPDVMRVVLADPISGNVKAERYLRNKGKDEKGTYYDGYIIADPGNYKMMAYNFDTETSLINGEGNIKEAKAYTNEIASHLRAKISSRSNTDIENEKIVYEPDHLFTFNSDELIIPYSEKIDTISAINGGQFIAQSIVKSYYLQVQVKGIQWAASTVGLLTGLSGSCQLENGGIDNNDSITVYFEMSPNDTESVGIEYHTSGTTEGANDDVVTLYTTFNTFGKIPELRNNLQITFDFITTYGQTYSETFDITKAFATDEAINNRWLLIDHTITIPEPPPPSNGGGGFRPEVDDWKDINTDIKI